MYQTDRTPLGLYVENGRELVRPNTASGADNFYIKPNGIFYVNGDSASILDARKFLQQHPHSDCHAGVAACWLLDTPGYAVLHACKLLAQGPSLFQNDHT
jgi:hypothetical protein